MAPERSRIVTGLVLQGLALFVTYASSQWLYAIGWLAMLAIGIPLFLAGIVVMMRAGGSLWLRLLLSFWPAAIPLAMTGFRQSVVALQWSRVRTEVFLIPAGYRGDVVVAFDDPEGVLEGPAAGQRWR